MAERRRSERRAVVPDEPLSRGKLRTGRELRVVDASSWGALAELQERLLPCRHLDLHIIAATGRTLVRARVVRAYVAHLRADAVVYRAGLAFDQALDVRINGYAMPNGISATAPSPGTPYPTGIMSTEIVFHEVQSS